MRFSVPDTRSAPAAPGPPFPSRRPGCAPIHKRPLSFPGPGDGVTGRPKNCTGPQNEPLAEAAKLTDLSVVSIFLPYEVNDRRSAL